MGFPWFGYKCLKGGVLYIALEGEEGFVNRIKAYVLTFLQKQAEKLTLPFRVIFVPINFGPDEQDKAGPAMNGNVRRLIATIEEMNGRYDVPARAVVYDNFRTATPGLRGNYERKSPASIPRKYIGQQTGSASFVRHNSGKDTTRGARGSQFHEDAADTEFEVKEGSDTRSFEAIKVRDGKAGAVHGFRGTGVARHRRGSTARTRKSFPASFTPPTREARPNASRARWPSGNWRSKPCTPPSPIAPSSHRTLAATQPRSPPSPPPKPSRPSLKPEGLSPPMSPRRSRMRPTGRAKWPATSAANTAASARN